MWIRTELPVKIREIRKFLKIFETRNKMSEKLCVHELLDSTKSYFSELENFYFKLYEAVSVSWYKTRSREYSH